MTALKVAVLVSIGRHPVSGRPRRAIQDSAAADLALRLTPQPSLVHAGNPDECLREYLALGIDRMTVLQTSAEADALPALVAFLRHSGVNLVLMGSRSEAGMGSGILPYLLAEQLDFKLIPEISGATISQGDGLEVEQTLAGGRRRRLAARFPLIGTIGAGVPPVYRFSSSRFRDGRIEVRQGASATEPMARSEIRERPFRPRPKRLGAPSNAAENSAGKIVRAEPDQAADIILNFLAKRNLPREH